MTRLRRLLRRQDGITLVMAVGILGMLTLTGTTLVYYSNTNARSAQYSDKNRNPNSAADVTRTLTAKVPVVPTYTQPLNNPSWNFIYSRGTGSACDMTVTQSVLINSPLYVAGNLCLQNSAAVTAGPLIVHGGLTMSQSGNYAGTSST